MPRRSHRRAGPALAAGLAALLLAACGARAGAGAAGPSAVGQGAGPVSGSGVAASPVPAASATAAPSHGPLPAFDAGDLASIDAALQAASGGLGSAASSGSEGNLK